MKWQRLREYLGSNLWFVPTLFILGAMALSLVTTAIDRELERGGRAWVVFLGGAESARTVLSTIASSMITFTGLVFTITMVVLQLASQQFSPRVLRTFLRDAPSKLALGIFVATFTFAAMTLRTISSHAQAGGVVRPAVSVSAAYLLLVSSVVVFIGYISHMSRSIRVSHLIHSIGEESRLLIERTFPREGERAERGTALPEDAPRRQVRARAAGVLIGVETKALARLAAANDCSVVIVRMTGDFIATGQVVALIHGPGDLSDDQVLGKINLSEERTMQQDLPFGFRQLVDIAERALSPGINDPTTAVMSIDQMHHLLRLLALRPFPSGHHFDDEGRVRVVVPETTWEEYVSLAVDEIRQYAKNSLQVARRLRAMLDDLAETVRLDRLAPLKARLQLLDSMIEREYPDLEDRQLARQPDQQGMGS